jgi:putative hydrolase of the HAD superfamily
MAISTLFIDLDGTLYPSDNGLWEAIRDRMNLYIKQRFGMQDNEVVSLRHSYYQKYGTTLKGLQIHYQVDADEYLAFVHDLPLREFIQPAPRLRHMLLSLPYQRWIFTNADSNHAIRVLEILGVSDCFEGIIDVRAIDFACKPEEIAYQRALALAGNPTTGQSVFVDDSAENVKTAHQLGFKTILVGRDGDHFTHVDFAIPDLLRLPQVLQQFK